MIHILHFKNLEYNFKINVAPKTTETHMSFSIELHKVVTIDHGIP